MEQHNYKNQMVLCSKKLNAVIINLGKEKNSREQRVDEKFNSLT